MEDTINGALDLFRDKLSQLGPHRVRTFYYGDPLTYASFDMPAIAIAPGRTRVQTHTTGRDMHHNSIIIFLVVSASDEFAKVANKNMCDEHLIQAVEGIRDVNGVVTREGVLTLLRGEITLNGRLVKMGDADVSYLSGVVRKEKVRMARVEVVTQRTRLR